MSGITFAMKRTIAATSLGLAGVGVGSAFAAHADLVFITAAWTAMFIKLADQAGKSLEKNQAMKLVAGVLVGVGCFAAGFKLANTALAYTAFGTLPAMVLNASINALMTWLVGRAWAHVLIEGDAEQSVDSLVRAMVAAVLGTGVATA